MSQPYIGEIRLVGFNFAPAGWATCNGQLIAISQNQALFQLIGTTYGGDGQNTFALPDLQSRVPMHQSGVFVIGQKGGVESVSLNLDQVPRHNHVANANSGTGNTVSPVGNYPAGGDREVFAPADGSSYLSGSAISSTGGGQPHDNIQPYLTMNFVISLFGVFPTQT